MKTGDICRGPSTAVLATAFLSGKSWGTPAEQAPGRRGRSGFTAAPGSPWPPLLLAASVTSQLCWLLGGVKPKQNMCVEPQKAGRLVSRPTLPSPKSGPLSGGAPASAEQGWPGHGRCGRRTPAFLPLRCGCSRRATGASAPPKERTADLYGGQRMGSPTSPPPSFWEFHLCIRKNWGWGRKELLFFF